MYLHKPLVPKNPDGILRVLLPGRVSTPMQDLANIDATQQDSETWLRSVYKGPIEFHRVGEQASGWLVNRPSMAFANDFIKSGLCDLVLVDEYREIYRNPKLQWEFVQDCEDCETRLIARRDGIDTANEDWEYAMHLACLRHGLTVPETRGRIKRTATYSFSKGGMVMKVRFGYRKLTKEEAASGAFGPVGLRIAKVVKWTPVIQEIRRRILAGYSDVMVADWLNAEGIPAPPYATSGKWSGQLVRELMTDPILSGQRAFRKTISKIVYGSGEHRSRPNPSPLQDEKCEGLAHLTVEEHEELLRFYGRRKAKNRGAQKSGRDNPLYGKPRNVSLWPGQSVVCSACMGKFYVCGSTMKCQHALPKRPRTCWNHVCVPTQAVRDAVLPALLTAIERDAAAKAALLKAVWGEYQACRRKWSGTAHGDELALAETNRQIARMMKALKQDGELDTVRVELSILEKHKKALLAKLAKRSAPAAELGEYATAEALGDDLPRVLDLMARASRPFALLLRRLLPDCIIVPVQDIVSEQVRPRLRFTISFALWAGPLEPAFEERHEVDLFMPPQHIQHIDTCRKAQRDQPDKTLRQLATMLGINYMMIKRSIDYYRCMDREGLTVPYRVLTEAPPSASRWKGHRSKTIDVPPGPILDGID